MRRIAGSLEFINNKTRYCLWLNGVGPAELRSMHCVAERVRRVKDMREKSKREGTRKLADAPMLFGEIRQPDSDYIAIPRVSSERRRYIPIGFLPPTTIAGDSLLLIPNAVLYHFGILTSNVHMAWTRTVCGRLKSDYRYSKDIVYNTFPWPDAEDEQKVVIQKLAQAILDARNIFPDNSLADLYNPDFMPPELIKVHRELDRAVMKLYGFPKDTTEAAIVAALMEQYQRCVSA